MYTTLQEFKESLPIESQERIEKGIEKEKNLIFNKIKKLVTKRLKLIQLEIEKREAATQQGVSTFNKKGDEDSIYTLTEYVKSLGCTIDITVNLPNGEAITLKL